MIRVLYVDDEPSLLEISKFFLERTGEFEVDTLNSAIAALPALESGRYDAIISDYQMPEMDGIAFLKAVRQNSDIPFILFTGRGREEIVIEAINNGVDFYLQKGGDPKAQFVELAHKVKQAVSRRQAQIERDRSEENFQNLVNNAPEAIFTAINGKLRYVNAAGVELLGAPNAEALIGTELYDRIHPSFHESVRERVKDLIEKQVVVKTQDEICLKLDGTPVHVDISAVPLHGPDEPTGLLIFVRDITERKQAEERLKAAYEQIAEAKEELKERVQALVHSEELIRKSEEKYRILFERSMDGVIIISNNRFTDCNEATLRLLGMTSKDQLLNLHPSDFSPPFQPDGSDSYEKANEMIEIAMRDGSHRYEWLHKRVNGELFFGEITLTAIPLGDEIILHASCRDITDRKKAEK